MSKPLTERLRSGFGGIVPPVCDEAANEIERLRRKPDREAIERVLRFLERTRKRWVDAGAPLTTLIDIDHAIDDVRFVLLGNESSSEGRSNG